MARIHYRGLQELLPRVARENIEFAILDVLREQLYSLTDRFAYTINVYYDGMENADREDEVWSLMENADGGETLC